MKTFGARLKNAREDKGYESAERFAHLLNMNPHAYRKYERGQSEPNFETLLRMCQLLDITPNDLLEERSKISSRRRSGQARSPAAA
jgi:transcriptional regulator with XRE-family HTH domain